MRCSMHQVTRPVSVRILRTAGHSASRSFVTRQHRTCLSQVGRDRSSVPVQACTTSGRSDSADAVEGTREPVEAEIAKPWHLGLAETAILGAGVALPSLDCGGGGGGADGSGGGGGGGGGGGSGRNSLYELAAGETTEEDDEEYTDEEGSDEDLDSEEESEEEDDLPGPRLAKGNDEMGPNEFKVDEIIAEGWPEGEGVPTKEEVFAPLTCQPGYICSQNDLSKDLRSFLQWNVFQDVQSRVQLGKDGKSRLVFNFIEPNYPEAKSIDVVPYKGSAKLALPKSEIAKVRQRILENPGPFGSAKHFLLRNIIESWYAKQGLSGCYITHIDGMDTGNLKVRVLEGRVNNINVIQVDSEGNPTGKRGNIPPHVIYREIPFKKGALFKGEDLQTCLRDVFGLGLFESMSVQQKTNERDDTKMDIDLMVKERPGKTADLELEWQLAPTDKGRPGLVTLVPGGSLTYENLNILHTGRQFMASATTSNFLQPSDDLGFQITYKQPDLLGISDPKRTDFQATVFNTRKISAVFAPGSGSQKEEIPPTMVDRFGAKLMLHQKFSRNSKGCAGVVLEQVTNYDDQGSLQAAGTKPLITGEYDAHGPPTSLSGTGKDRLAFLQGNLLRDATYSVNGMLLGARDELTVEQGVGIGSGHPVFNRHKLSVTRFHQLDKVEQGSTTQPKVLVLQGRYGGTVGDLAPYDLATLGGPFSARGFNVGEIASARFFLEAAAELRIPVKGKQIYLFAEHATDLGTSAMVQGNPTQYFKRPGSGTSLGAGAKIGAVRMEFATEGVGRKGNVFVRFGERF